MTGLERQYRILLLAYPPDHRARHEQEIVTTLLDVAAPGQRHPRIREATAIVGAGLACRLQDGTEIGAGLRLAGLVALAATFSLATMALVLATQMPPGVGLLPAVAWLLVAASSALAAWSPWSYRLMPAATIALVMVMAGSSVMGLRRTTVVPAAMFLILSAACRSSRRPLRTVEPAAGIALGAVHGAVVVNAANQAFQLYDSAPWVYTARWDIASDTVAFDAPLAFAVYGVATVALGLWRPRYALAGALLATPLATLTLLAPPRTIFSIVGPGQATQLSIAAAAGALILATRITWRGRHQARLR